MIRTETLSVLRFSIPQSLTSLRLVLGVWATFAAVLHQLEVAATLIIVGVVTDGLDGVAARRLKVVSEFGARFDYFADFVCYVVVPSILSLILLDQSFFPFGFIALGLPVLTGALRYARNTELTMKEDFEHVGYPGLATLFYCFFIIALVFLASEEAIGGGALGQFLLIGVPAFSLLMLAPVRYPKLVKYKWILIPVILGLNLMPFVLTTFLAFLTLACIFTYTLFSPLIISQRPEHTRVPYVRWKIPGGKDVNCG